MKFQLIDSIEIQQADRIVVLKQVSAAEEYLGDHFPRFPVLPGVLMLETMAQAARLMLAGRGDPRLVLGKVRAIKFSSMVRPGEALRVEITLDKAGDDGEFHCRGKGVRVGWLKESGQSLETAVSGRFIMRPPMLGRPSGLEQSTGSECEERNGGCSRHEPR